MTVLMAAVAETALAEANLAVKAVVTVAPVVMAALPAVKVAVKVAVATAAATGVSALSAAPASAAMPRPTLKQQNRRLIARAQRLVVDLTRIRERIRRRRRIGPAGCGGPRERSDAQANPAMDANAGVPIEAGAANAADTTNRNESRAERPNRNGERGNRTERGERRPPRNQAPSNGNAPAQEAGEPFALTGDSEPMANDQSVGNTQDDGASREKRSRDRYGRERKPRGERVESAPTPADAFTEAPSQQDDAPRKSYFKQSSDALDAGHAEASLADMGSTVQSDVGNASAQEAQPVNAVATVAAPALATAPAASAPERVAPAPVPVAAAPAVTAPAANSMPAVASYALPVDQLVGIAQGSGLTWVNSNAEKIAAVQAAIAAEPKPVHVPRERPPVIALDDRPLVLVETRLDLRDISLPFEETQPG